MAASDEVQTPGQKVRLRPWQWLLLAVTAVVVLVALMRWWPRWLEKYRVRHERIRIQAEAQRRVWLQRQGARYRPVPPEQIRRGWLLFAASAAAGTGLLGALAWWWWRSTNAAALSDEDKPLPEEPAGEEGSDTSAETKNRYRGR